MDLSSLWRMACLCMLGCSVLQWFGVAGQAAAQSVCLPLPRLLTTMPMGGAVGSQVEITVTGDNLDELGDIYFSHPGIVGAPKRDAANNVVRNQFVVTIASDCPPGLYEARVMTRLGISSSRIFSVGTLPEVIQGSPNVSLETAMELKVNTICNAVMSPKAVDHYRFEGRKGQRYVANCEARGIDSKLDAVLIIADSSGRDLIVERRGGALDFTAPEDGSYVIKVHELTFKGGPAYFYRLSLQELASDAVLPQFASTRSVNGFSWPPVGLGLNAATAEEEPNGSLSEAREITLPCDLAGSFFPAADVDTFKFNATKGDVWWIEVASERLGRPTDPSIIVQHVSGEGDNATITDVAEFSDIPSPMKPSSNGYAYDGPPYDGGSSDIIGKLEIKNDGLHLLQISDLFGGTRNDNRNIYRLIIRKAAPDFALVAWGLHMELRNGDRNALSKPIALRGGATMALEVIAARRDGFDGEIEMSIEGMPDGVSAQGLKIPAGQSRGIMLITAHPEAPNGVKEVSFVGKSILNGEAVTRPVQMAAMAWPVPDAWNEIPMPRLVAGMPISVTNAELAPMSIAAAEKKVWEARVGEKLTIPLSIAHRGEFSGSTLQLKAAGFGFEAMPRFDVPITADKADAVLDLGSLKVVPGDYLIAFYGPAVAKYQYNLDAVTKAKAEHEQALKDAAAVAEELKTRTSEAESATPVQKTTAEQNLAAATAKKQTADAVVVAADNKLKAATATAAPQDTVDIVISEPIAIRVNPAEPK
jgi:nucleotide-binding universal stress UspA family protein